MAIVIILLFLAALAFCGWGVWMSCRLMFRTASRMFAPTYGPPAGPPQDGHTVPATAVPAVTRPVPAWAAKAVADHLAKCVTCRLSYVEGTLPLLEQETIERILGVIETETAVKP